jgi:uncharacterized protein
VNAREIAQADPPLVLEGTAPRLIDEWQIGPDIWNHVRRAVDDIGKPGQFILTGSTAAAEDVARHSGAGRMSRLAMRPMSLLEAGRSSGGSHCAPCSTGTLPRPNVPAPRFPSWSTGDAHPPGAPIPKLVRRPLA